MPSLAARAGRPGALARIVLGLVLAFGWTVAAAMPAAAVDDHRLVQPAANERVTGPTTIRAEVDANPIEEIDRVEVRLLRGGNQVGGVRSLDYQSGDLSGGRSTWATPLDPLASWATGGAAMPNGRYTVEVRARSTMQQTRWRGHEVRIDVPPPKPSASAQVVDRLTRSVEVTWTAATVPDFRRYVVQRVKGDGDSWSDVAEISTSTQTRILDVAPDYGTWRYRVVVSRDGVDDRSLTAASDPAAVTITPPGEPEPDDPLDDPGDEADDDAGDGDDSSSGNGDSGDGDDGEGGDDDALTEEEEAAERERRSERPMAPRRGRGSAPQISPRNVPEIESEPAPHPDTAPRAIDPGQQVFEEHLYDLDGIEPREITEREIVMEGGGMVTEGGTITVMDRELALEQVLPPVAGGLLLFVVGGHVMRLARLED